METSRFLNVFIGEATRSIDKIDNELSIIKNEGGSAEAFADIKNAAYTLKTISFTMGYDMVGEAAGIIKDAVSKYGIDGACDVENAVGIISMQLNIIRGIVADIHKGCYGGDNIAISLRAEEKMMESGVAAPSNSSVSDEVDIKNIDEEENSEKYIYIRSDEFNYIKEFEEKGLTAMLAIVKLCGGVRMSGERLFLIYTLSKKLGQTILINPRLKDIEACEEGNVIEFILMTAYSKEYIYDSLNKISQVEEICLGKLEENMFKLYDENISGLSN